MRKYPTSRYATFGKKKGNKAQTPPPSVDPESFWQATKRKTKRAWRGLKADVKGAWHGATSPGTPWQRVQRTASTKTGLATMVGLPTLAAAGIGLAALMSRRNRDDAEYGYGYTTAFTYLPETKSAMGEF